MYVAFDVPEHFRQMPVGMSPEEAYAYAFENLPDLESGDAEVQRRVLREVHGGSQALARIGALYSGSVIGTMEGEPSLATMAVTATEFPYGDSARVAAEGVLQSLVAARGQLWSGNVYGLPCGQPAAVVTGPRVYQVPQLEPSDVPFAELQAYVPVPDGPSLRERYLLTVSFATPAVRHWDRYMPTLVRLLRGISFSDQPEGAAVPVAAAR
ncbi:hypothetical protein RM844_10345 [Streptomyces sp. DSM 44915]|uniref:Uncharacterized protein n=1 Tax=Streptomyces chisholmiae TaxID=3075540 RepID=A0ABU2JP62_9ACTN|nr:hypothetical protein [Streptomyces sp. DSM 44915]MDT0266692.1 hypothetical protein [Streptomyces sp. DSM 44915]